MQRKILFPIIVLAHLVAGLLQRTGTLLDDLS